MKASDPKAILLKALQINDISVETQTGKELHLIDNYTIEIEGENLYKLLHQKQVIAPFDNVEELCSFIKMDRQLNEEN